MQPAIRPTAFRRSVHRTSDRVIKKNTERKRPFSAFWIISTLWDWKRRIYFSVCHTQTIEIGISEVFNVKSETPIDDYS